MKILDIRSLLAFGLFVLAPTSTALADAQAGNPKGLQMVVTG
jgi:hypothetical protein